MILGDTTAGRVLRISEIDIGAAIAGNISVSFGGTGTYGGRFFNQDSMIGYSDMAAGYNGTNFALSADGSVLTIKDAAISGTIQGLISCEISFHSVDSAHVNIAHVVGKISSSNIVLSFYEADWTIANLIDTVVPDILTVTLCYITSA